MSTVFYGQFLERRIQVEAPPPLWGLSPTWTSKIYGFQGLFRSQQVLTLPEKKKNLSPPGQIPEYAPEFLRPSTIGRTIVTLWLRFTRAV